MANALYAKGKQAFLSGSINMSSDTIKVQPVDVADYTVDLAADDFLDDVPSGAKVGTAATLANKSVALGVFDADDTTITGVTGDQFEALVIYKDTGSAATSPLIAYIDTATGLPITPSGGNIVITWDNGANKIFKL